MVGRRDSITPRIQPSIEAVARSVGLSGGEKYPSSVPSTSLAASTPPPRKRPARGRPAPRAESLASTTPDRLPRAPTIRQERHSRRKARNGRAHPPGRGGSGATEGPREWTARPGARRSPVRRSRLRGARRGRSRRRDGRRRSASAPGNRRGRPASPGQARAVRSRRAETRTHDRCRRIVGTGSRILATSHSAMPRRVQCLREPGGGATSVGADAESAR